MTFYLRLIACLVLVGLASRASALDASQLEARIQVIAAGAGSGTLGVAVLDPETGQRYVHHGDRRFPMQSVYKLPIAVAVLRKVDEGSLSLDRPVTVSRGDLSVPFSPIARHFKGATRTFSIRDLLRSAVSLSDNSASDLLMRIAGGASAVTALLRDAGIAGIRVDRLERDLQPQLSGLGPFRPEWADRTKLKAAMARVPDRVKRQALESYLLDPRDTATPSATVDLLAKLKAGALLSPASTKFLLEIMVQSPTGAKRLKAGLPAGSVLAHKTGTSGDILGINAATNDVGIATLPDGRALIRAVYLAGSDKPARIREQILADVARAAAAALN